MMWLFFILYNASVHASQQWNRNVHLIQEELTQLEHCSVSELLRFHILSRYDLLPEDPDIFERAVRLLQGCHQDPEWERVLDQEFGRNLVMALIGQQKRNHNGDFQKVQALQNWHDNQEGYIAAQISQAALQHYREDSEKWVRVLQSEHGGFLEDYAHVCRGLLAQAWKDNIQLHDIFDDSGNVSIESIKIPIQQPGQFEDLPIPECSNLSIKEFQKEHAIQKKYVIGFLFLLLCLLSFKKYPKITALFGGFLSIVVLELCLTTMQIQNMAMTSPLFSLTDWQYMPFQKKKIDNISYWESYGGSMRANRFVVEKEAEEKRIAVLGASSAHGSNHLKEEAFAGILEQRWRIFSQDKKRFVWNLGIGGTTSNGVLHMGMWALEQQLDGLIIYYGHNEAAQFSQLPQIAHISPLTLRIQMYLSQSRLYFLLRRLLKSNMQPLIYVSNDNHISLDKETKLSLRDMGTVNLRYNFNQLIERAKSLYVPVLIVNPTYNFRSAPSTAFDDNSDELRLEAELASSNGEYKKARRLYKASIEAGDGITTITSDIQKEIHRIAEHHSVYYLDAESVFYKNSPDGLSANGLFWDELHPSRLGHEYLADSLWEFVELIEMDE